MKQYKTEYYPEICCDECNEIIHNHFDCPACGEKGAGTSIYSEIEDGDELECEECGAKFIIVSHMWDELILRRL